MKAGILAEPIMVGRKQELEELESLLNSALEGKGKTVFVSGEAGNGKTRLAREFLSAAKRRGVGVMAGWCLSDSEAPYFPFVEAFNAYFASFDEEEQPSSLQRPEAPLGLSRTARTAIRDRGITAWLTGPKSSEKPSKPEALSPQVWKDQVFAGVARTLHEISAQSPIVLFLEDIHWADSASLALLHYVARAVNNSERILVLATFRSEELTADAEGHPHPLAETLRMMRREDLFTEIKLSSLDEASVSKIAESMIGGCLQPKLAEKLTAESRGNPLFVVESMRMLNERRSFFLEDNQWRLAVDELGIPAKIKDIILRRLAGLKYAQRRVLDAASVIGEKFDVELLSTVLGLDSLEVLETLNVIAHSTSLVNVEENFYRFDHSRSRETLYEELSPPLKRGYHGRIAEKLESAKGAALPLSDLAFHFAQAGNKEKAVKYALAAGQDALARWSNAEAIKHFAYVLKAVGEDPKRVEEKLIALEGLGDALYANSVFKEATRIFEEIANTAATDVVRLRAFRKAMEAVFQYGDAPYLMELAKKAEPYAAADRLENARVLFSRGRAFHLRGMVSEVMMNAGAVLQVFEEEYSLWDIARSLIGLGGYHTALGKSKEGLAESLRSVALFEELGDFRGEMEAGWTAGVSLTRTLLLREALEMLAKVIEIDEKMRMGDYLRLVYANRYSSDCFALLGKFEEALSYSLKALEFSKKTDSIMAHGVVYSSLTKLYTILGDMKRAEEYFEKLVKLPPEILRNALVIGGLSMAVYFAGKHQWDESGKLFSEGLEVAKHLSNGDHGVQLEQKQLYSWALERQGRLEEARIELEECQRIRRKIDERFEHADLQAHLMIRRQAVVGEEREMRLDLVNVGRKPCLVVRIENVLPDDFEITSLPSWCSLENSNLEMKNKEIGPFQVNTAKLTLKSLKAGTFTLNPKAVYVDDLGETKTCNLWPVTITANPQAPKERVAGKISTGTPDLDHLLLGGLPENYAVLVTSSSTDEREQLIKRFLEAGAAAGETAFYVTTEAGYSKTLAEKYPSNFFLFICNPQADTMVQSASNVFKLKGVENLTDIDIALTKAFRTLNLSATCPSRICIEIVSDVLLQHHAVTTRRWLSALLPTLKSKGFVTLAVFDPCMHPYEEVQAVLGLFEGEINVTETETARGRQQVLRIRKLYNQKYLETELILDRERLKQ